MILQDKKDKKHKQDKSSGVKFRQGYDTFVLKTLVGLFIYDSI